MVLSKVDYTIFFRKLSYIPEQLTELKKSFYLHSSEQIDGRWNRWLQQWRNKLETCDDLRLISAKMKRINPKYTWREWLIAPAYEKAEQGDYSLINELQSLFSKPYEEQSLEVEKKYYHIKPNEFFNVGGISHYSCSS